MLLSEIDIALRLVEVDPTQRLVITPLISVKDQFGPSSIDIRLGTDFAMLDNANLSHVETKIDSVEMQKRVELYTRKIRLTPGQPYHLHPGGFVLASTLEFIRLPLDLAGRIEGRSSWGRLGLLVHATAGFIDPGYKGTLTLELSNTGRLPIALKPGLRIGQVCFFKMLSPTRLPYGDKHLSKYSGATTVESSKLDSDPEIST